MRVNREPKEIYQVHRDHQRERILEAAEKLFIQEGIDNVSISAIAEAARISRRTLYQYFSDKREIAWAIFQKIVEQLTVIYRAQPDGTGYQRLEQFMAAFVRQFAASREHARFIVEFNALYAREANAERMRQMTGRARDGGDDGVTQLIRQGIQDGSIRADVEPELISAVLLNLLSGINARFALLGELITQEYGQPMLVIYEETCRVFLRGLQAE
jgi:AcrR family transcriptional regulator